MAETKIRRTYKDSLFRMIFREKEELPSLYNAVNGSDYQEPELECVVTYLNINFGHNQELMSQLAKGKQLKAAADHAVEHCIKNQILDVFLRRHRAEVTDVILREYNEERHIKNEKEISYQEGVEIGKREGVEIGKREGMEIGKREGIEAGKYEMLKSMIKRKYDKNKTLEIISEELDLSLDLVKKVIKELLEE